MSTATAKRTFLYRTFHPIGQHVCAMSGMPAASADVDTAQFDATQIALDSVPDRVIEHVIERARWVTDVIGSTDWGCYLDINGELGDDVERVCPDCGMSYAVMTLQEVLVKFYLAMRLEDFDG
jgi:hypothetical protein